MIQVSITSLLATLDWPTLLWWIDVIFKVAVGLGAVIFVHELGHFLVAKACGVKCEKFMIGFDIGGYKISRRWGETEYGIGILPLGGYVKMLGQDDDPAHIAEQLQKSEVAASSSDAVEVTGPNGEKYFVDRRSYLAKSVPQRMAIISAGVIMNVIFAFIFAVIAFGEGVPYMPCIVSETVPGSSAWQARIEPADEIIQIGDRVDPTFMQLRGGVTLGDLENGIRCVVRRAADGEAVEMTLTPTQEAGRLATVGIGGPLTLKLMDGLPVLPHSPAERAKLVTPASDDIQVDARRVGIAHQSDRDAVVGDAHPTAKLQGGDEIVRVGDAPVGNYRELAAELAKTPDEPLLVTVRRPAKTMTEDVATGALVHAEEPQELTFEVPAQPLRQFGLIMKMGPITAVQADSPAAKAGLAAGDLIEMVDGQAIAEGRSDSGWDPVTLPQYLQQAAEEGREVELTILRSAGEQEGAERPTIRVTPVVPAVVHSDIPLGAPMAAEAVGIAYRIENQVQAIRPDSPAAASKIAVGDVIAAAKIILPKEENSATPDPVNVRFAPDEPGWLAGLIRKVFGGEEPVERAESNWPALVDAVQFAPAGTQVEFTIQGSDEAAPRTVKLAPQPADGMFVAKRGFFFEPIVRIRKAESFDDQLRYGWDETAESLTMVFRFLKKLGTQVPITALGGPVTIAKAAGYSASEGMASLLIFLTMLSANLAVINFLPIPLLDGGHMVFLAYEGIRGRPANERFVVALHTAGFVLIVSLMLYVLALDLELIPRNL